MYSRLINFIEILYKNQFCFQRGKSTEGDYHLSGLNLTLAIGNKQWKLDSVSQTLKLLLVESHREVY